MASEKKPVNGLAAPVGEGSAASDIGDILSKHGAKGVLQWVMKVAAPLFGSEAQAATLDDLTEEDAKALLAAPAKSHEPSKELSLGERIRAASPEPTTGERLEQASEAPTLGETLAQAQKKTEPAPEQVASAPEPQSTPMAQGFMAPPGRKPEAPSQPAQAPAPQRKPEAPIQQTPPEQNQVRDKGNLGDVLAQMRSIGVKGFNWGDMSFVADDQSPSGYRVLKDHSQPQEQAPQQVANKPQGLGVGPGTGGLY